MFHLRNLTTLQLIGLRIKMRRAKDWTKIGAYTNRRNYAKTPPHLA